jgi:hypothetical protein
MTSGRPRDPGAPAGRPEGRADPGGAGAWPSLPLEAWRDTYATLHMWTQVIGKIRLARAPMVNHWWHVPLYVTARGLTTSPVPYGTRTFQIDFDFITHRLSIVTSDGAERAFELGSYAVAEFYERVSAAMTELGLHVKIWTHPVEVETSIPFEQDREHATYDPEYANRLWRILLQADRVLHEFRGGFLGKASPVHFFWGGFDLAMTFFSGRPAPPHPGGVPNVGDQVNQEAYSHECSSAGFWPGGGAIQEPAFYAYTYPEPDGYADHPVRPEQAFYSPQMRLFVLRYEDVRGAADPDGALLAFLRSTYGAAAELAAWDRAALEREPPRPRRRPSFPRHGDGDRDAPAR